jgi:hypothetical protein
MSEAQRQMPRYQSHKTVWALKISALEIHEDKSATIAPADNGFAPFKTRSGWAERFTGGEEDTGYFVRYADGFTSWSPTKAFEAGYAIIPVGGHGTGLPADEH